MAALKKNPKFIIIASSILFFISLPIIAEKGYADGNTIANTGLTIPQKGTEAIVSIPPEVREKWKAIKISVMNKNDMVTKDYIIKLGDTIEIPDTKLSINALEFVPSFAMQGLVIISASNEPNNPAAKVMISEDGREMFRGWLFQKFPNTHAFSHPDYAITLSGGVEE